MKTLIRKVALVALLILTSAKAIAAPPDNDNFDSATDLGSLTTTSVTGTTDEATIEPGEPFIRFDEEFFFDFYGSTIWWKWKCPAGGKRLVTVSTHGSTEEGFDPETFDPVRVPMDTRLMVFSGPAGLDTQVPKAESLDAMDRLTSEAAFIAEPEVTYYIRVDAESFFPFSTEVKLSLNSTAGTPTTADAHVAWGKVLMTYRSDWDKAVEKPEILVLGGAALTEADTHFNAALALSKNHPEANLLHALVSLLKLQKDEAFKDLLDDLGIQDDMADEDMPHYSPGIDLDGNQAFSPTANSSQAIAYGRTTLRPRLVSAALALEKITSTTFLATMPEYLRLGGSCHLDYGDVQMLRGGCKVLLALLDLTESFQMAAKLQDLQELKNQGLLDTQHVLDQLGDLLKFSGTDKRSGVKTNLQEAIALYGKASTHIRTKRPLARDPLHLFPLRDDPEQEASLRTRLDQINKSLGGATVSEQGWSINLGKILTGKVSLNELMPSFKGNRVIKDSVPKPDMAGILPGATKLKIENLLRDNGRLWEDLIQFDTQVSPGEELFGSVNESGGLFLPGTNHSISATALPGYVFSAWRFNDRLVSTLNPYVFPVVREYTLLAHFSQDSRDDDKDGLSNYAEVQAGTNLSSPDTDDDGWPDGLDEDPKTPAPGAFMVSQELNTSLRVQSGRIISIKNQPPGVSYDAVNQRLVGRPGFLGATVSAPKSFTITATVKPDIGPSFNMNITFNVIPLPQNFIGTFNGIVNRGAINNDLGGSISLSVTNSGSVTGKLIMAGVTYNFPSKLQLNTSPPASSQAVLALPAMKPVKTKPAVYVSLSVDPGTGTIQGTVSPSSLPGHANALDFTAELQVRPASGVVGTYNAQMTPADHISNRDYPQGSGYSILKVGTVGTVTWAGKFADGTAITAGGGISAEGRVALHQTLYGSLGSVQGWTKVNSGRHSDDGLLSWVKKDLAPAKSRSYPQGFPEELGISLNGSLYNPKTALFTLLGLNAGDENTLSVFTEGGLVGSAEQSFRIDAPAVLKVAGITSPQNLQKLTLSITTSSGIFKGSVIPQAVGRKASFEGILVPHLSIGDGFFLLPESNLTTSLILSGRVIIRANDE
jgi:hypothetical protein